jgi:RNA polymerase I-specific transcription initiation factor RRN7
MDDTRETRRLPRGEKCSQCGDRKFYLENGMRFCSANGHEIEVRFIFAPFYAHLYPGQGNELTDDAGKGFVQYDIGDEEDSGRQGVVARRQKEIRERENRHLTGLAGQSLYLEALQLVLRNQLQYFIREKGYREELETIARDLWDLRIRAFSSLAPEKETSSVKLEMFSSQSLLEEAEDNRPGGSRSRSWDPDRNSDWPMPRVIDTLALCYLSCLLLKVPISIGQLYNWTTRGDIPYERMVSVPIPLECLC